MKIVVLGTRGFPRIQGGVEAHCENLYPQLVRMGCEVTVFGRAAYLTKTGSVPSNAESDALGQTPFFYKSVKIVPLAGPKNKFLEAIIHTFKGIFQAKKLNPEVLHIHAVGPALMVPFARMMGFRVVFTHHGPDYERKKWGFFAKLSLRMGEFLGVKFANEVIAISQVIADEIKAKYGREITVIPNGVVMPGNTEGDTALKEYGLNKGKYILAVGRFVPEKGFCDLVEAFGRMGSVPSNAENDALGQTPFSGKNDGWKLVIAGDADHEDKYSLSLKEKAKANPNIVLTGFISGEPLEELYSHAGLFVLPSYYEGLPIVLLEAMSYGLSCIVSDIPANREVGLENERYFKPGDIDQLKSKIAEYMNKPLSISEKELQLAKISQKYNWNKIAEMTLSVYGKLYAKLK